MNISFEEEREFVKTNSKEYFSLGNDCFQSNLNNCVNFVTTIRKLAKFLEFKNFCFKTCSRFY